MRVITAALLGLAAAGIAAGPVRAQSLNDVGRLLQDQVLGGRPAQNPDAERQAYEQGRRDAEDARRRDQYQRQNAGRDDHRHDEDARRRANDDRRRFDQDDRQRADDAARRQRDMDRQRADQQRAWADEQRARTQSGRY